MYADGGGLYLRITASGAKSWIYRYSSDARLRDMGLGSAALISLAQAREKAAEARQHRACGTDPITNRQQRQFDAARARASKTTFRACAEQLMSAREAGWRNSKHRAQWRSTMLTYAYPILGDLPVEDVETRHVLQVVEPIWTSKTETASRVRGRIETVLSYAKARGLRATENVATWRGHLDQILPAPGKVRRVQHYRALPYMAVPALVQELRRRTDISSRALEFVILTAVRTSEGLGATWDEFDLDGALWTLPEHRMKAGRTHRVPLSAHAVQLLRSMVTFKRGSLVFPGIQQGRPLSNMALLMLLRALRPGYTVHGFRSSFRDWSAECTDFANHVVEMSLAHIVSDKVEAAYRRGDLLAKRRQLAAAWEDFCSSRSVNPLPKGPICDIPQTTGPRGAAGRNSRGIEFAGRRTQKTA